MNRTAILFITDNGRLLAQRLKTRFSDAEIVKYSPAGVADLWGRSRALVFIMATGIVVRTIAGLLQDKKTDPAVIVLDEKGKYAISLSGGHLGGANELAREIARALEGEAVITTASDVSGLTPIDLWARDHDLAIEDWGTLPLIGTRLVNSGALRVYVDREQGILLPDEYLRVAEPRFADVIISNRKDVYAGSSACAAEGDDCSIYTCRVKGQLYLRPRNLVIGIGCNSGTTAAEIGEVVRAVLEGQNLSFLSIETIATIDRKGNEPGLRAFVDAHGFDFRTYTPVELNSRAGEERSDVVFRATGAFGVAEPAALLASGAGELLVRKQRKGNVTVAVAEKKPGTPASGEEVRQESGRKKGKIYIVGTGPGSLEHITPAARTAIEKAEVVVGYGTYLALIEEILQGKEVVSTGMTQEVDRCRKAVDLARQGSTVAVISGGDPGIYAMAGLVFELLKGEESPQMGQASVRSQENEERQSSSCHAPSSQLYVEVVPGISALNAAASRLGAPLMHDFACISLSDRLTPWEKIEKRLDAAAKADFVIVLYNPRSKGRAGHLDRAREIVLRHRKPDTAVGVVQGATRDHERVIITDLACMKASDVDMQTTVIIGNSSTFIWNDLMITPRGYENKLTE